MILLGSVKRFELERLLWMHLNSDQKVVIPEWDHSFTPVPGETPASSQPSSRAPSPLSLEYTDDKPKSKNNLMNKFVVLKVDESADKPHKRDHKPPTFTITRSVSPATNNMSHLDDVIEKQKCITSSFQDNSLFKLLIRQLSGVIFYFLYFKFICRRA